MTKVTIKLDYVASLLVSYHILCCPTERDIKFNSGIFRNLTVSPDERARYLALLQDQGIMQGDYEQVKENYRQINCSSLDEVIQKYCKDTPTNVVDDLRNFEPRFMQYMRSIEPSASTIAQAEAFVLGIIDSIYSLSKEFTTVDVKKPSELEIRLLEGISPNDSGGNVINGKTTHRYQLRNLIGFGQTDSFLNILIHECVGHKTVRSLRSFYDDIFGNWIYHVEEGYVKVLTTKISETIQGKPTHHKPIGYDSGIGSNQSEVISFDVFNAMWQDPLRTQDFAAWYRKGLVEVKRQIDERAVLERS